MMNIITENMKGKNLIQDEKEKSPGEGTPQKVTLTTEGFLTQMGVEWEKKGRAIYIYPSSLETVKNVIEKMPLPNEGEYAIIPLGSTDGYNVFIMITARNASIRIGYGRNSIPFNSSLVSIMTKLEKVAKEIGIESRKNGRNLLG